MIRLILLSSLLALPVAAQDLDNTPPPETAPMPEPRPDPEDRLDDLLPENTAPLSESPISENLPDAGDSEEVEAEEPPRALGMYLQLMEDDATFAACTAQLTSLGTVFTVEDAAVTADDADCGIARPVIVSEIVTGVHLRPTATVRCETAAALGQWVAQHVVPAAEVLSTRSRLTAMALGGSYTCRRRNNLPTGKLSEHAFGNAIDIMSFQFEEGDPIPVEPRMDDHTIEEAFQRAVRATSCLYFTTVLGPGANAAHADHLHMDIAQRNGGYRLCQ